MAEIYSKILKSIYNNINNQEIASSAFKKYAELQGLLVNYNYRNVLLLATQANKLGIPLSDVRSFNEWKKVDKSIQEYLQKERLYIYQKQVIDGQIIDKQEAVFDISQTNSALLGIRPIAEILNDPSEETLNNILEAIVEQAEKVNVYADIYGLENKYNPLKKELIIKYNDPIETKLAYFISRLTHELLYGEKQRELGSHYVSAVSEEENEIELVVYSLMKRLNISYFDDFDSNLIRDDIEETFNNVEVGIKEFLDATLLNQLIKSENLKSKEIIEVVQIKPKRIIPQLERISDDEIKRLREKNRDAIVSCDPISILEEYCNNVKLKAGGRYEFRKRDSDSTSSCSMKLIGGIWRFIDFGDGDNKGTIIKILTDGGMDWKEAYAICINRFGLTDYVEEAIKDHQLQNMMLKKEVLGEEYDAKASIEQIEANRQKRMELLLQEAEEKIKEKQEENLKIEKESTSKTMVSFVSKTIPWKYKKMMTDRGIDEIPENMYYIEGVTYKRDLDESGGDYLKWEKQEYITSGIGVLTSLPEDFDNLENILEKIEKDGEYVNQESPDDTVLIGADVHFPPYIHKTSQQTIKTKSFGVGGITLIKNGNECKKIAVFESKMDYAAANQVFNFKTNEIDVIIANSVSNVNKMVHVIMDYDEVYHFNQYDIAGVKFQVNLITATNCDKFKFIDYHTNEYKQDINDLLKNNINLKSRLSSGDITVFASHLNQIESHLIEKGLLTELISKEINTVRTKMEVYVNDKQLKEEENISQNDIIEAKKTIKEKIEVEMNSVPSYFQ